MKQSFSSRWLVAAALIALGGFSLTNAAAAKAPKEKYGADKVEGG